MPSHTLLRPAPAPDARRLGTTHPAIVAPAARAVMTAKATAPTAFEPLDQAVHEPRAPDQGQPGQQRDDRAEGADRHHDGEERDEVGGFHEARGTHPPRAVPSCPTRAVGMLPDGTMFEAAPAG